METSGDRFHHIQVAYSKMAFASFSLGLLSWIPVIPFTTILSVIFGIIALFHIEKYKLLGKSKAMWGMALGVGSSIFWIGLSLLSLQVGDNPFDDIKKITTLDFLRQCAGRIELFKKENGRYPTTLEELNKPQNLTLILTDSYGKKFFYKLSDNAANYELRSLGPDGTYDTLDDIKLDDNFMETGEGLKVIKPHPVLQN